MTDLRTVEVLRGTVWKSTAFENLKEGDFFRLFEPDGKQVLGEGLSYMFEATGEVYKTNGISTIDCIPVDPTERGLEIEEYVVR